jgi:hypothetical protein
VHDPTAYAGRSPNVQSFDEPNSKIDVRTLLTSNAMESRTWEEFAIGNAAVQVCHIFSFRLTPFLFFFFFPFIFCCQWTSYYCSHPVVNGVGLTCLSQNDIPRDVMSRLLRIHWVWISPMFMWVYRPAFMRKLPYINSYGGRCHG